MAVSDSDCRRIQQLANSIQISKIQAVSTGLTECDQISGMETFGESAYGKQLIQDKNTLAGIITSQAQNTSTMVENVVNWATEQMRLNAEARNNAAAAIRAEYANTTGYRY